MHGHEKVFKDGCKDEHFDCFPHKKKKDCDCDCGCKKHDCRCHKKLVKDCVCVEWSVPHGETQTVFQSAGLHHIFASGFISFDCGSSDFVLVRFFLENTMVGSVIKVFKDSAVAFTFTDFDRITVECPEFDENHDSDCPNGCEGEICITVRHPVC